MNNDVSVYSIVLPHCGESLILSFGHAEPSATKIFFIWRNSPQGARASSFTRFLDKKRRTTIGKTPLDE